jgi:GDP-4-dehydro-6-deoxy-D-mannose reductase
MRVGNVTARRDFSDVRDVVRAYALLADKSEMGGVFNVCSGSSHSVQECIDVFMKLARVPLHLEVESSRIRTAEIDEQVGDPRKLCQATGWQPEISFSDSLKDLLEYHRQRHRNGEN